MTASKRAGQSRRTYYSGLVGMVAMYAGWLLLLTDRGMTWRGVGTGPVFEGLAIAGCALAIPGTLLFWISSRRSRKETRELRAEVARKRAERGL